MASPFASRVAPPEDEVITAVRDSWATLPDEPGVFARLFYQHLFGLAPQVRGMFPPDMSEQHVKLSKALLDVVGHLDNWEVVAPRLRSLGAHHARHLGVTAEQYPFIAHALIRAVRDVAPTWSSALSSYWIQVYEWISATMLEGAGQARTAPSPSPPSPTPRPYHSGAVGMPGYPQG